MRKLERTLREMKMESLWPNELEDSEHLPPPKVGWSNLFHQELNQDFHRDWDMMDWGQEFAPELVAHFMSDQRTTGNQSGHSISSPMFNYSQKNFHISDGNLYSVLSPFQSRKSTSRPTFLRGQPLSEVMSTSSPSGSSPGTSEATSSNDPGVKGNRNRRMKLKFHQQNIPAQYRTSDKTTEAESLLDPDEISGQDRSHSSSHRSNRSNAVFSSSTSSSSSSSYSKSLFSEKKRDSFFKRSAEDEFDLDNIFSRGRLKDDPFEALDLSKPHEELFKSDWVSFDDEFDSSYRLRKSQLRRSFFEDSDNDDEEPLNLCIADHVKKHRPKGVPIKVKREPLDSDSDSMATPRQSPFSASRQRFERSQRSFFANHSPSASIFRRPSPDISFAKESANSMKRDQEKIFFAEKDEALDLSFKKQQKNEQKRFFEESITSDVSSHQNDCCSSASSSASSFKLSRGKKVPYISEMLENMSIWDEDGGQSRLKSKPRDTYSSVKKKSCAPPPPPTKPTEELVVPSWKKTVEGSSSADAIPNLGEQKMSEKSAEMHQCNKSSSDSDIRLTGFSETKKPDVSLSSMMENVPGPNYYVLLPSPLVQPYGMTSTYVHPNVTATATSSPNKSVSDTITIHVPSMSQDTISEKPLKGSCSSPAKIEIKPKNLKPNVNEEASKPLRNPGTRQKRLIVPTTQSHLLSDQSSANDISICKFKLVKGVQPMLEEKKSFFVSLPRTNRSSSEDVTVRGGFGVNSGNLTTCQKPERFKTYKIHVGSQEEIGKKLAAGKKIRRRSRKTLVREKLEATFREQGFLIKTQQVSSAEGAVYCKFRQLKKFTRYLFKSWRNYLPKDLEEISTSQSASNIPSISLDPSLPPLTEAALSLPDIPAFAEQLYSPSASRCSSFSGTSGLGTSILSDSGPIDNNSFVDSVSVDGASMVTDGTNLSDSCLLAGISPCPSTSSLPCASPSSSSIT